MNVVVLGSCGTWPGAGRAASGYLVRHDGHALWLDAGTGTLAALQRHADLAAVDAVLISHEHVDHCIDLLPTYYAIAYGNLREPGFPLLAPTGLTDRLSGAVGKDYRETLARSFAAETIVPAGVHEIGPFRVTCVAMPHVGLPAFGFRVEAGGRTIAYTGDTGPGPEAVALAPAGTGEGLEGRVAERFFLGNLVDLRVDDDADPVGGVRRLWSAGPASDDLRHECRAGRLPSGRRPAGRAGPYALGAARVALSRHHRDSETVHVHAARLRLPAKRLRHGGHRAAVRRARRTAR